MFPFIEGASGQVLLRAVECKSKIKQLLVLQKSTIFRIFKQSRAHLTVTQATFPILVVFLSVTIQCVYWKLGPIPIIDWSAFSRL